MHMSYNHIKYLPYSYVIMSHHVDDLQSSVCSKLVANQESSMTNDAPTIHIVSWQDQIHEAVRFTTHQMNFA